MQNNQSPNTSYLSLRQWLSVLLTLLIILLTVVLSILVASQSENSLITSAITIFGLIGTAIGILSLPLFKESLQLFGKALYILGSIVRLQIHSFARGFTALIKQLPPRWNYVLIVLSLATTIFSSYNLLNNLQRSAPLSCQDGNNILHITKEGNEDIGISNSQSCKVFTSSSISNAYQAEIEIYKNNPSVAKPHITLIVTTMLSGTDTSSLSSGTALLQGVDIAQQEYNAQVHVHNQHLNKGQPKLLPLRLLIANAGSNEGYAVPIAEQIKQLAQHDHSIIGVVGWPFSTNNAKQALQILDEAHIPSVASSLSSNSFSNTSSYFFRVVPPNTYQASAAAGFLKSKGVKHVIVCIDYNNDYSSTLANNFIAAFASESGNTIDIEKYTRGMLSHNGDPSGANARMLGQKIVNDLNKFKPSPIETQAVYFAGYANDLDPLKGFLLSTPSSQVTFIGGDGLDEYGADTVIIYSNYQDIYFTTFSSYQIWQSLAKKPCFLLDYKNKFNPNSVNNHLGYGFAENDAILAYDATTALLIAYLQLPENLQSNPNPDAIKDQLTKTSFWGVSGQINLTGASDPQEKALYINYVQNSLDPAKFISSSLSFNMLTSSKIHFPLCESIP